MRYLVTGGAGFIGSHIVERLLADGHSVRVLDDLSTGSERNLAGVLDCVEFARGRVQDAAAVASALDGVDGVFHQAAIPSVPRSVANPSATHESIVDGTIVILEEMRARGGGKIVLASSSSLYGESKELPKHEEMRPDPLSPYAAAKLAAETYAMVYARLYGIKAVALRYFNVFGPRQDPKSQYSAVIPKFITAVLDGRSPIVYGDGSQSRDFTYVENVVEANLLAMNSGVSAARINIAAGGQVSLLTLIATIGDLAGREVRPEFAAPRSGDIKHSYASIHLAESLIGYRPRVGLREGLSRTMEHLKSA